MRQKEKIGKFLSFKNVSITKEFMEEIKGRNRQIYEKYLDGEKYADLAKEYSLTISRIKEICRKEEQKEINQENAVYRLLMELCTDEKFVNRTFTVLKRMDIVTEEEFLKLDRNILKKTRNCGLAMEELIIKGKNILESRLF